MKSCEECKKALHDYLDGELSVDAARSVEEHMEGCEYCAQEKEDMFVLLKEMRKMREVSVPESAHDAWVKAIENEVSNNPALSNRSKRKKSPMRAVRYVGYAAAALVILVAGVALGQGGVDIFSPENRYFDEEAVFAQAEAEDYGEALPEAVLEGAPPMGSINRGGSTGGAGLTALPRVAIEEESVSGDFDAAAPVADLSDLQSANDEARDQKLIREVQIYFTCLEYEKAIETLGEQLETADGYIEYSANRGSSENYSRSSEYNLRIPADALDAFLESIRDIGKLTEETQNAQDASDSYYDAETRLNTLRKQYARLEELMDTATRMEDIIAIEDKMTAVLYDIESLEGQLQNIDSRADFSSVYVSLQEQAPEREIVPTTDVSLTDRVSIAFFAAINGFLEGAENLALFAVRNMFSIILALIGLVIVIAIARGVYKKIKGEKL